MLRFTVPSPPIIGPYPLRYQSEYHTLSPEFTVLNLNSPITSFLINYKCHPYRILFEYNFV